MPETAAAPLALPPPPPLRPNRITVFLSDDALKALRLCAKKRKQHPGAFAAAIVEAVVAREVGA